MSYKIYRRKKRLKAVVHYKKNGPYVFNPSFRKNSEMIDVNKLSIYNLKFINNILIKKYDRKYRNLLKLVYILFNDSSSDSSACVAVLGEVDRLKGIITSKYHNYLEIEKEKQFLKELQLIENEVKKKFIEFKLYSSMESEYFNNKSR